MCFSQRPVSFWSGDGVSELLNDHVAKNLMYIEAVADTNRCQWEVGREEERAYLTADKRAEVGEAGMREG